MCHIAHNCVLKEDVALAYPCQLGGSTHIEKNGYLASATVRNQSIIGEGSYRLSSLASPTANWKPAMKLT